MYKTIIPLVLACVFTAPLEAAPLAMPSAPSPIVSHAQWDGDWEGQRDWRRDRGWHRGWGERRHWRMRQARRDCYRYGDCRRWSMMQERRDFYGRDWRRHHRRGGLTLQFGF